MFGTVFLSVRDAVDYLTVAFPDCVFTDSLHSPYQVNFEDVPSTKGFTLVEQGPRVPLQSFWVNSTSC